MRYLKWLGVAVLATVVGLVVAYWTPDTDLAAMRAKYGAAPSQFVDLGGGLTVHVRDEGPRDAPVLVLLHGSNADLHTWDPWVERLSRTWRVVRYDQIGHGLTGPSPTHDYSLKAFTDLVDEVRAKLGIAHFALAGNSMGGGVALSYAVTHPDRLDGLILVDASGAPDLTKQSFPIGFRIARTPLLRNIMLYLTPRDIVAQSMHQAVSNQAVITDSSVDRTWELLRYPGNRRATLDRFAMTNGTATTAALATLKVPTLILWGAEDKLLPVSGADFFARNIPGATKIVYPATGHLPMEEVADASAADVDGWLAKLPRRH